VGETEGTSWLVRAIRPTDAGDLHRNCYPEQPLGELRTYLNWCRTQMAKGRMERLVAEVDGHAVGNGQLTIRRREGEIGSLVVAPAHRRRGIGRSILAALVSRAAQHGVQVLEIAATEEAVWLRAWYERLGFVPSERQILPRGQRIVVLRMVLASG
jgi:N-acetylglutamate synthase-like GNAT family acetyltransferase